MFVLEIKTERIYNTAEAIQVTQEFEFPTKIVFVNNSNYINLRVTF